MSLLGGLLAGCYTVTIKAQPATAAVSLPDGRSQTVPGEVRVAPLSRRKVTVTAVNHRPLVVPVPWRPLGWARRAEAREIEVFLVEEHGPAGTQRARR